MDTRSEYADSTPSAASSVWAGAALAALAGLLYAGYTYTSKRAMMQGHGSSGVMGATFGLGGVLLIPVLILSGSALLATPTSIALTAYLALGPVLLAFWLFGTALKHVHSRVATTVTLIEPVIATVLAVTIVREEVGPLATIGVGCVVAGLFVTATRGNGRGLPPHP